MGKPNDMEYDESVTNKLSLLLFPEELEIVRTGRICTVEEMEEWVGEPCDEWTPGCATCDSWHEWRTVAYSLLRQDKFRKAMKEQESE
jgi:hypothetical protein